MHPTSMRHPATSLERDSAPLERVRNTDPAAAVVWLLGFALVVYLGLKGGGYDPLVHDQVGIVAWWIVLAGVGVGALPRRRPRALAWAALALLAAFVAWTALSLGWTDSTARTSADLARLAGYLGIFALAVLTRVSRDSSQLVGAVAAGIVVVAGVALLSRLHPAWFPEAGQTASFIADSRERLSYPVNYWNGLAGLVAIGLPLVLQAAAEARSGLVRVAAAAALPALALTIFFTLSRGGIAVAAIAVAIYLSVATDRIPKLLTAAVGAIGGGILVFAASQRDALQHGLSNDLAHHQGAEMLWITLVVCAVGGLAQVAISYGFAGERRPRWTRVSRRQTLTAAIITGLLVLVLVAAFDLPGRASHGWSEFKKGGGPGSGTARLNSVAGQSRYQLWQAALHENATKPLIGTGSGTFELWWARHGRTGESVRDTHSLYLQTLGELGVVGFMVLIAFIAVIFVQGGLGAARAGPALRSWLAAAIAGCAAFFLTALVDWMWQLPALAVATLLLASLLVTSGGAGNAGPGSLRPSLRVVGVAIAIVAIVAIAIPLASTSLLRESEADAHGGDLDAALGAARSAQNVQPGSAAPRLQEALVQEAWGDLTQAAEAAQAAIDREPVNWRNWLVMSRIDAELGRAPAAARDYRRARFLNPESPLFER